MKSALAVLVLALSLVFAGGASAAIITSTDGQGRRITFDVRATAVDTNWYADVLRGTAHGNEISNVTIRIVPERVLPGLREAGMTDQQERTMMVDNAVRWLTG